VRTLLLYFAGPPQLLFAYHQPLASHQRKVLSAIEAVLFATETNIPNAQSSAVSIISQYHLPELLPIVERTEAKETEPSCHAIKFHQLSEIDASLSLGFHVAYVLLAVAVFKLAINHCVMPLILY
jgi:hypothetical protein